MSCYCGCLCTRCCHCGCLCTRWPVVVRGKSSVLIYFGSRWLVIVKSCWNGYHFSKTPFCQTPIWRHGALCARCLAINSPAVSDGFSVQDDLLLFKSCCQCKCRCTKCLVVGNSCVLPGVTMSSWRDFEIQELAKLCCFETYRMNIFLWNPAVSVDSFVQDGLWFLKVVLCRLLYLLLLHPE